MGFVVRTIEVDSIPATAGLSRSFSNFGGGSNLRGEERINANSTSTILLRQRIGISSGDAHWVRSIEHLVIMTVVAAVQVDKPGRVVALFGGSGQHAETLNSHVNVSPQFTIRGDGLVQRR